MQFVVKMPNRVFVINPEKSLPRLEKLGFHLTPLNGIIYSRRPMTADFPTVTFNTLDEIVKFIDEHGRQIRLSDESDEYDRPTGRREMWIGE